MQRPMATLGFAYFLALIIASVVSAKVAMVLAALCFVAFMAGLLIKSIRQNGRIMTVLLAAMAAFSMYTAKDILANRPLQEFDGKRVNLKLQTLDIMGGNNVTAKVIDGDLPKGTRITLWLSGGDLYPEPYDILTGEFFVLTPIDSQNGQVWGYSKSRNIFLNARPADYYGNGIDIETPQSKPWMYKILQARRFARNTVMSQPGMRDVAGLMIGIAFGFKGDILTGIENDFRAIGVSHLLAVSGLHVTVISQAILGFLLFIKVPRRLSHLVAVAGVFLFMALTGFQPSILRAGIMSIIFLLGQVLGREPDSLNSLGFSVFAITFVNPFAATDLGLLLSFTSTYGILDIYPQFQKAVTAKLKSSENRLLALVAKPVDSVLLTFAATIPTLPVLLLAFGQISLIAPVSNLLMVFPTSVVTIAVCLAVALYAAEPLRVLTLPLFWVGKVVSRYLVWVAKLLASVPYSSIWAHQRYIIFLIPAAIVLIMLGKLMLGSRGMRVMALWSAIALLCGTASYSLFMRGVTEITLVSSGNATAMVFSRGGYTGALIMGEKSSVPGAVYELQRRNVRKVDFLIIPDPDDKTPFYSMEFTKNIRVNCLITGPKGMYSDTVERLEAGGRLSLGQGAINFWNDCHAELNNGWIMIRIGLTRVLISPGGGSASDLPANSRSANLLVITGKPPEHVSTIKAQAAVLNCRPEDYATEIKAIPRVSYPLYNTARKNITFYTRGKGDIKVKGGSAVEYN